MKQGDIVSTGKPLESIFEPLTPEQQAQLARFDTMPVGDADLAEIPELDEDWFRHAKTLPEVFPRMAEAVEQARHTREHAPAASPANGRQKANTA